RGRHARRHETDRPRPPRGGVVDTAQEAHMRGSMAMAAKDGALDPLPAARAASDYLGPARGVEVAGSAVSVELPGGEAARATMALAFPYRPAAGDTLLVVGRDGAWYVIGVLEGTGETVLSFSGGVEVRAEGGPLRLSSDQAVELSAPEVGVDAGRLR